MDLPIDELYVQLFCDDLTLLDSIYVLNNATTYFIVKYCDDSYENVFKLV